MLMMLFCYIWRHLNVRSVCVGFFFIFFIFPSNSDGWLVWKLILVSIFYSCHVSSMCNVSYRFSKSNMVISLQSPLRIAQIIIIYLMYCPLFFLTILVNYRKIKFVMFHFNFTSERFSIAKHLGHTFSTVNLLWVLIHKSQLPPR